MVVHFVHGIARIISEHYVDHTQTVGDKAERCQKSRLSSQFFTPNILPTWRSIGRSVRCGDPLVWKIDDRVVVDAVAFRNVK